MSEKVLALRTLGILIALILVAALLLVVASDAKAACGANKLILAFPCR